LFKETKGFQIMFKGDIMKKLSRVITTAMVAATMVMSTACANSEIKEVDTTVSTDSTSSANAATEATVEATEEASVEDASTEATSAEEATEDASTEATSTEESEESTDEARDYERGVVEGTTYTNESLGLVIDLPSEWTYYSDEQLAAATGVAVETFDNDTLSNVLENVPNFVDMYAVNSDGVSTVNVGIEKKSILTKALDAQGYVDAAKASTAATMEAAGFENVEIETSTVQTANGEIPCLNLKSTYGGSELYQVLGVYSVDDYFVTVTSTVYFTDNASDIFQYVSFE